MHGHFEICQRSPRNRSRSSDCRSSILAINVVSLATTVVQMVGSLNDLDLTAVDFRMFITACQCYFFCEFSVKMLGAFIL